MNRYREIRLENLWLDASWLERKEMLWLARFYLLRKNIKKTVINWRRIMNIHNLFHRKPQPDLFNLVEYEADLLRWKERGIPLRPPPSIPSSIDGNWTNEEMAAMSENRRAADEIYNRISGGTPGREEIQML